MHRHDASCYVHTFPLFAPYDDMLTMLVCATCWLYMHLYMPAYMSMHESCLLVCHPYFNTMKLWKFDPNLHLSPVNTTFCLFACLFACFLALLAFLFVRSSLLIMSPVTCYACHIYLVCLLYTHHALSMYLFLPLLVCWFLVFAFACIHME